MSEHPSWCGNNVRHIWSERGHADGEPHTTPWVSVPSTGEQAVTGILARLWAEPERGANGDWVTVIELKFSTAGRKPFVARVGPRQAMHLRRRLEGLISYIRSERRRDADLRPDS